MLAAKVMLGIWAGLVVVAQGWANRGRPHFATPPRRVPVAHGWTVRVVVDPLEPPTELYDWEVRDSLECSVWGR